MTHLSARVVWHDTGWNGRVCQAPHLNASCIVHEIIRDKKDDAKERASANIPVCDLPGWMPPCSRDILTYSPKQARLFHSDPLERKFLKPIAEDIPPYSVLPAPYRWLREEYFRDVCEEEHFAIRGPDFPDKANGWVMEPDRQEKMLANFWGKIAEGEGKSLVFYYVNQGNPVDENAARMIVGVGRIAKVSQQLYFDGKDEKGNHYPIWTRAITQDYPNQGFRLPYQEYIQAGYDPKSIACVVPRDVLTKFMFVAEHLSDDVAIRVLEQLLHSVEVIREEGKIEWDCDRHATWLNDCLDEVWKNRGPYPGIASVLQALGFPHGTAFQRTILRDFVRQNKDPLAYVIAILEDREKPPEPYRDTFSRAQLAWRGFGIKPIRQELLKLLTRFELTTEQVKRITNPDERERSGIKATEEELLNNPYLISEMDLGSATSDPVGLDVIDRGMVPEGDGALFIPQASIYSHDDNRRIRATATAVLSEAAELGDTVFSVPDLFVKIRSRFTEKRACRPDRDLFMALLEYYRQRLWISLENEPPIIALRHIRDLEEVIAKAMEGRSKRINPTADPPIDWVAALQARFGPPKTEREQAAQNEKAAALNTLFSRKISILTGSAGTGKTSALKVFLDEIEKVNGNDGTILLAPTGKARVRLATVTKHKAYTIHQFLLKNQWFLPDIFVLKREGGGATYASTIIIDECSMIPVDLLGTLFKAINLGFVTRLILVGDPNQLPPIGPGRPFVDLISWMREEHPECVATLRTTMRVSDEDEAAIGASTALTFAEGYRGDGVNPGDDEILSLIAQGKGGGDLEVHFWEDFDGLKRLLKERMQTLLGIKPDDHVTFAQSLGISSTPYKQDHWKDAERWQILSPVHGHAFGTDELNRSIQQEYKIGLIRTAQMPWGKFPKPFGDEQIVYTDKVIQVINRRLNGWPQEKQPLNYVANGEIGIVTNTNKTDKGDYLQVGFSTQEGVTYRYYRSMVNENLELAYALTVHKSQGSDFDYVFLIIPHEAPTLSRELIYTGLTRFRRKLILLVEKDITTLRELRQPERSDTHRRNTFLFDISLRPEQLGAYYPETLIHRTSAGVAVRSKSEVIVADTITRMGLMYEYERPLASLHNPNDFRLPDFTIGYQGDIYYWEHLGMMNLPSYREGWERKRRWYQEVMKIPVIGAGVEGGPVVEPGVSPIVITSRDGDDGGIQVPAIEQLIRRYILLEE